jgi:hypothetical protein
MTKIGFLSLHTVTSSKQVWRKANAKTPNRLKNERFTKRVKKGITLKSKGI